MKKSLLTVVLMMLFLIDAFSQCPMCKASVESSQSTNSKSVGMGLNIGILMLLGSVYVILFTVGFLWYKNFKKSQEVNG
jgi:hypothetical protein